MNRKLLLLSILMLFIGGLFAQDIIPSPNNTGNVTVFNTATTLSDPWGPNSIICGFVHTYIFVPAMLIVFVIFLAGVAVISGAAFPEWRNYGSKMVLGPIGAAILYVIGTSALHYLLGVSVCGL